MTEQEVLAQIDAIVQRILTDKGMSPTQISAEIELLGGEVAMDSLDLAMLVRELEEVVGHDPFKDGFIEFRTAGELAKLYAE